MYQDERSQTRRERTHRIAEMLEAGMSHQAIGSALGVSGPAVSQWIARTPSLRRLRSVRAATERERLKAYRSELEQTYRQVMALAQAMRRSMKAINEEIESHELDELLGL